MTEREAESVAERIILEEAVAVETGMDTAAASTEVECRCMAEATKAHTPVQTGITARAV
jgi:hypothetical protein